MTVALPRTVAAVTSAPGDTTDSPSLGVPNLIIEMHFILNENLKRKLSGEKESLPFRAVKNATFHLCMTLSELWGAL